jgi:hypothetical protein
MSKTKNNVNALLAAIKRQAPESAAPPQIEEPVTHEIAAEEKPKAKDEKSPAVPQARKSKTKSRVGKAVQFWMHEADTQLVRELYAWLAGQGVRPNDSLVVRAALRYAKTGSAFLEAYREASRQDGRLKQD